MKRYEVEVEKREETGKGAARRLRRNGFIPGIVYGKTRKSESLIVDPRDISNKLNINAIIDLKIVADEEEDEEVVMIKDYQKDVIKGNLIHVDFQQISMDEKIAVTVPINLVGDAYGVQEGGVLQQLMREVEIEALPDDVPDELDLDISELDVGDSLQVSDLEIEDDIDIMDSLDEVIVTVVTPSEEITEEVIEEAEEEFIEPEVIGEEEEEETEVEEGEEEEEREEE
ncbi:MAG: 50S ribosomal protein L25 [Halanaerobiales bacterium]